MRSRFFKIILAAIIALGASSFAISRLSPVGRLSAAFPLSPPLAATRNEALKALPWSRKLPFLLELHSRMKLRALTCAENYSPSWAAPVDEVITSVPNPNCFLDVDKDLARWIGFARLGPILRQPPLRPVPRTAAKRITDRTIIQAVHFPARAGVVILEKQTDLRVADIATGTSLLSLKKGQSQVGRLSPNGRIFLLGGSQGSRAVDTETGVTMAELPGVYLSNFFWIDDRTAVFSLRDGSEAIAIDFETGKELTLPGQTRTIEAAAPVPGAPDQFVVGYARATSKFQLDRSKEQPLVRRLTTRSTNVDWDYDNDGLTADGRHYVSADGALAILDLQAMELKSIALGLFHAEQVIPTYDPKRVVLRGTVPFEPIIKTRCYLYDLNDNTLAPLKCGETSAKQPLYLVPMQQYGTIDRYGIEPADLAYATAHSVDEQVLAWMDEDSEQQRRQLELENLRYRTVLKVQESRERLQLRLREMEQSAYQIRDPARQREMLDLLRPHMQR